ncbi:hypothetical protein JCM21714_2984 [Gracilibacillus boraciitolerans JCM 21714]|uniref:Uncharacterized protein n=1 Tax=Gracilibacillus boraciitolerans JCM 21714 TaxID=1298598 RepID=W4VM20_9BACI|nr:hypothetical protein [Gracilibacillus boraciitolerans]GAE93873.1 hypothetical protein JCM21714_2984 [Gracilibacillus boraciitolerans JCM 21714]
MRGNIVSGDEITEQVTLGYHNLLPLPNGVQVLAPTWEFEVNNNEFFYVNAIEGHYAKREMASFIEEMKLLIEEYFAVYSTAQIEATNEEWQEQDVENFVQQLLEKFEQKDGVE